MALVVTQLALPQSDPVPPSRLSKNLWLLRSRVQGVAAYSVFSPSSAETVISSSLAKKLGLDANARTARVDLTLQSLHLGLTEATISDLPAFSQFEPKENVHVLLGADVLRKSAFLLDTEQPSLQAVDPIGASSRFPSARRIQLEHEDGLFYLSLELTGRKIRALFGGTQALPMVRQELAALDQARPITKNAHVAGSPAREAEPDVYLASGIKLDTEALSWPLFRVVQELPDDGRQQPLQAITGLALFRYPRMLINFAGREVLVPELTEDGRLSRTASALFHLPLVVERQGMRFAPTAGLHDPFSTIRQFRGYRILRLWHMAVPDVLRLMRNRDSIDGMADLIRRSVDGTVVLIQTPYEKVWAGFRYGKLLGPVTPGFGLGPH
ncbi:MAG TPA: hypothetical protein VM328_13155 [Fimbriimonadaceae bacterium]|nr:hypothetical protein [Fimbriimonadaceae bacterium]